MRISDWSSDVCSSDLQLSFGNAAGWTPAAILAAAGSGIRPEPLNTGIISLYCSCYVLIFDGTAPILPASWMQFGSTMSDPPGSSPPPLPAPATGDRLSQPALSLPNGRASSREGAGQECKICGVAAD